MFTFFYICLGIGSLFFFGLLFYVIVDGVIKIKNLKNKDK